MDNTGWAAVDFAACGPEWSRSWECEERDEKGNVLEKDERERGLRRGIGIGYGYGGRAGECEEGGK